MSSTTNSEWLNDLAAGVLALQDGTMTQGQFVTTLLPPTDGWIGIAASDQILAEKITKLVSAVTLRDEDFDHWVAGGPEPAGPYGNGTYPLHTLYGGTIILPSPQQMQKVMMKGDPAKVGVVFEVFIKPPPNTTIGGYKSPGNQVFTNTGCIGYSRVAATGPVAFTVLKNGAVAGTVSFAAGSTAAVFALTGGQVSLVRGDLLEVTSPGVQDATLSGPSLTFSGD